MLYQNGYITYAGNECFNSCLANYFQFCNIPVREYEIFFFGQGYRAFYEHEGSSFIIGTNMGESTFSFLDKVNVVEEHKNIDDRNLAEQKLIDCINGDRLMTIVVMSNRLSYDEIFVNAGEMVHYINVVGYDDSNKKVRVSDGYVPATKGGVTFEGWLDLEEVLKAWEPCDFEYYVFNMKDNPIAHEEIQRVSRLHMKDFLTEHYFTDSICKRTIYQDLWERLFEETEPVFDSDPESDLISDVMYNINYNLKLYGFMMLRYYIYDLLKYNNVGEQIVSDFDGIIGEWIKICLSLVKISFSKSKNKFIKLQAKIFDLLDREREILLVIRENVDSCLQG